LVDFTFFSAADQLHYRQFLTGWILLKT